MQSSTTRFGRGAAASGSFGSEEYLDHGNHDAEVIFGIALNDHDGGAGGLTPNKLAAVRFYDGASTKQATVTIETDGSIALRRGDESGTIVTGGQTAAGLFNHSSLIWDGYAFRVKFHGSTGQFQIWKNGVSVFNASSLNTIATANAYSTKFATVGLGTYHTYMDDVYYLVVDATAPNSFPGDTTVYTLFPSGAGSSTQWTASTGSNYQCVDDPNGNEDGDYVSDATVGHIDEYTLDDLPGGFSGTILAAQYNIRYRKDDATTRQVAMRVNSGGTIAHGATVTCASSYQTQRDQALVDPHTSAAWTGSGINALKIGPEVIT